MDHGGNSASTVDRGNDGWIDAMNGRRRDGRNSIIGGVWEERFRRRVIGWSRSNAIRRSDARKIGKSCLEASRGTMEDVRGDAMDVGGVRGGGGNERCEKIAESLDLGIRAGRNGGRALAGRNRSVGG